MVRLSPDTFSPPPPKGEPVGGSGVEDTHKKSRSISKSTLNTSAFFVPTLLVFAFVTGAPARAPLGMSCRQRIATAVSFSIVGCVPWLFITTAGIYLYHLFFVCVLSVEIDLRNAYYFLLLSVRIDPVWRTFFFVKSQAYSRK